MVFLIFLVWFSQQWFKKRKQQNKESSGSWRITILLGSRTLEQTHLPLSLLTLCLFFSFHGSAHSHRWSKSFFFPAVVGRRWGCNSRQHRNLATHKDANAHTHTRTLPFSLPPSLSLSLPHCFVASVSSVPQLSVTNWCCGTFPFCSLSIKLAERCSTAEFNFTVELGCWLPCQTQINARLTNMDQETPGWQPASACWPMIEGHETGASQQPPPHLPQSDWLKEFTPCNYTPSQHIRAPPPTLSVLVGFSLCTCVCVSLWKKEK